MLPHYDKMEKLEKNIFQAQKSKSKLSDIQKMRSHNADINQRNENKQELIHLEKKEGFGV